MSIIPKELFFDRANVQRAMDRTTRTMLTRFGSLTRRVMKNSIRKRKSPSQPGTPPSSRQGDLKRLIFFHADMSARDVVIGPVGFGKSDPAVPGLLERGGSVPGRGQLLVLRDTQDGKPKRVRADRPVEYAARPFSGPAGRVAIGQLQAIVKQARNRTR